VEHRTDPTELFDAEMHCRIAARIRRDPGVIAQTKARLAKVMAEEAPYDDPVLREWLDVLLMLDPGQVASFIESDTPRARRLRISTPLAWLAR
jgi:hypothetical protein